MANRTAVNLWYSQNMVPLNLRARKMTWTNRYCPGWFDYEASIEIDGLKCVGRGFDVDEETAFLKAASEAVERFCCKKLGLSTEGIAVHISEELARENALNEFIERAIYAGRTDLKINRIDPHSNLLAKLLPAARADQVSLEIFEIVSGIANVPRVVYCKVQNECFLDWIGLGAHEDLSIAAAKAAVELLRNLTAALHTSKQLPDNVAANFGSLQSRTSAVELGQSLESVEFKTLNLAEVLRFPTPLVAVHCFSKELACGHP